MLSFIYTLVNNFQSSHGIKPNLLFLSDDHLKHLVEQFASDYDLFQIMDMLEMEIIVDNESVHPRVAWTRLMNCNKAAC